MRMKRRNAPLDAWQRGGAFSAGVFCLVEEGTERNKSGRPLEKEGAIRGAARRGEASKSGKVRWFQTGLRGKGKRDTIWHRVEIGEVLFWIP